MAKIFKRTSFSVRNDETIKARKDEGYFCSEVVAAGYKRFGLLNERKACSQYWPGILYNTLENKNSNCNFLLLIVDFSSKKKLRLLNGAKLSNEIQIVFKL